MLGGLGLTFETDKSFGREERELLLTIARQCGQALERARLFEQEHEIAVAVQRSLLPQDVAVSEEVAVAARYLPASPGLEVGGDWYDVIRLGERELVVSPDRDCLALLEPLEHPVDLHPGCGDNDGYAGDARGFSRVCVACRPARRCGPRLARIARQSDIGVES